MIKSAHNRNSSLWHLSLTSMFTWSTHTHPPNQVLNADARCLQVMPDTFPAIVFVLSTDFSALETHSVLKWECLNLKRYRFGTNKSNKITPLPPKKFLHVRNPCSTNFGLEQSCDGLSFWDQNASLCCIAAYLFLHSCPMDSRQSKLTASDSLDIPQPSVYNQEGCIGQASL